MILIALNDQCASRLELKNNLKINGDIHDACDTKMVCNLTQHRKWNRKHYHFRLCECKRGYTVKSFETRKFQILDDDACLKHYEKSERLFKAKFGEDHSERNVKNTWIGQA